MGKVCDPKESTAKTQGNQYRVKFGHRRRRKRKNTPNPVPRETSEQDDSSSDSESEADWTPDSEDLVHESDSYTSAILDLDLLIDHMQIVGKHQQSCLDGKMAFIQGGEKTGIALEMVSSCSCGWRQCLSSSRDSQTKPVINLACTVGCVNAGIGAAKLNSVLSAMGCPTFRSGSFDKYEESVGLDVTEYAKRDMEQRRKDEWETADVGEGQLADVVVVGDGGWGKRSLGHSYDSSTGCSVVIGAETKKVLDLDVRCKTCSSCKRGLEHAKCYRNHSGSSGSMEAAGIVTMCNRSVQSSLRYTTYIGDGDSSVETALKTEVSYGSAITKVDCINHKIKNLKKNLKALQKGSKKELTDHAVNRICNSVTSAVKLRRSQGVCDENIRKLSADIRNSVFHVFNNHQGCASDFCKPDQQTGPELPLKAALLTKVKIELEKLAAKPRSLIQQRTSNLAETFMKVRSTIDGNKAVNRGQRGSWNHRCYASVLKFNRGVSWLSDFLTEVYAITTCDSTASYIRYLTSKRASDARLQNQPETRYQKTQRKYSKSAFDLKERCKDYGPNCELLEADLPVELLREQMAHMYEELPRCILPTEQTSPEWLEERRKRITASNFGKVCKRRKSDPSNLVKTFLYSLWHGNAATEYGHQSEAKIEAELAERFPGVKITHPSLTAHEDHKYVAGSPDGIGEIDGKRFLVEYKAPYSLYMAEKSASEATFLSGGTNLRKTHDYYYQIQGLMEIFDLPYCLLGVAGFDDFSFIHVDRDREFFATRIFDQLRTFYFGAILPELAFPMKRRGGLRRELIGRELEV